MPQQRSVLGYLHGKMTLALVIAECMLYPSLGVGKYPYLSSLTSIKARSRDDGIETLQRSRL
jgi:hypothetical protein